MTVNSKHLRVLILISKTCKMPETVTSNGMNTDSTRQLSYRKEDRAMRPIYGCIEKFRESSLRTRLLFQKFVMDFCSDRY